jgi:hypothetical protein
MRPWPRHARPIRAGLIPLMDDITQDGRDLVQRSLTAVWNGGMLAWRMTHGTKEAAMPKLLFARRPRDATEERTVRKLAASRHAPGDWIQRARMIARSWDGLWTTQIAAELGCHPQTVRERLAGLPPRASTGWGTGPAAGAHRG